MRIDLFKLRRPAAFDLAAHVTQLMTLPVVKRNAFRAETEMRLEHAEQREGFWLMDFVRLRMKQGPAKASLDSAVQGFDLDANEGFGEETAFLWDPTSDWCVSQYNHFGVRANAIAEYLKAHHLMQSIDMDLLPKIDETVHTKIRKKGLVVRQVQLSVAPMLLHDSDYDLKSGLGSAIKMLKKSGSDQIEIIVSARGSKSKSLNIDLPRIDQWVRRLAGRGQPDDREQAITTARATTRDPDGARSEVLDLLHHRVTTETPIAPGLDKRLPRDDRFSALIRAYHGWESLMT